MKKKFGLFALVLAAFVAVAPVANAQYSRREVAPPVAETGELDPSTPLGKVQEIAARLEAIESTTEEIGKTLESHKIPNYNDSIDKILEASGATRADVARLGEIASGVKYISDVVETVDGNTKAIIEVAKNVDATAKYLRFVPTQETVDAGFKAIEKSVADSTAAQTDAVVALIDAKIAAARETADADAQALKNKLETASNIIILLGLGILALFVVNVAKFIYDKAQQAQQAERERRNAEIRELVAASAKTEK